MGRYTGMALHAVVHSSRLGRDLHGMPLYAMQLTCGHTEERVVRSFVPKRTRCYQCQPDGIKPAHKQNRPTGVTVPLCVGCRVHAVTRRFGTVPPQRGWRSVGGVHWNWYCSEECACRAMGQAQRGRNGSEGSKATRAAATARALERLTAACKDVMDPDCRVPVKAMIKVFMVERQRWRSVGFTSGFNAARRRIIDRKAV